MDKKKTQQNKSKFRIRTRKQTTSKVKQKIPNYPKNSAATTFVPHLKIQSLAKNVYINRAHSTKIVIQMHWITSYFRSPIQKKPPIWRLLIGVCFVLTTAQHVHQLHRFRILKEKILIGFFSTSPTDGRPLFRIIGMRPIVSWSGDLSWSKANLS